VSSGEEIRLIPAGKFSRNGEVSRSSESPIDGITGPDTGGMVWAATFPTTKTAAPARIANSALIMNPAAASLRIRNDDEVHFL
jgi:hypothetical protein